MGTYRAEVVWSRGDEEFVDNRYSRRHLLRFDGGLDVPGSASPQVVAEPYSDPSAVDPEEAFVASLSSCHMLWFLSLAAERGLRVDHYRDEAVGRLGKHPGGKVMMTRVTLRPAVRFAADTPISEETYDALHHQAHDRCFIASSVRTEVLCEPTFTILPPEPR